MNGQDRVINVIFCTNIKLISVQVYNQMTHVCWFVNLYQLYQHLYMVTGEDFLQIHEFHKNPDIDNRYL